MKRFFIIGLLLIFLTSSSIAEVGFKGRPITNNVMRPTGYTLNRGEFIVGLGSIGFGITDNVQVGTNLLLFLFQVYNANLKVSLINTESSAFALGISVNSFNLDVGADEIGFTSLSPYAVYTTKMGESTNLHLGGQYSTFSGEADIDDAEASETSSGTSLFAGVEYSFSHKTKFLAEGGYDLTFEGFRIGGAVLFGWENFRLKLGVNYFSVTDGNNDRIGFTFPVIGLWWRFEG